MELIQNTVLAVVQGITELLPISSTGHLVILSKLFSNSVSNLSLTTLHLGTTIAIIVYYRNLLIPKILSKQDFQLYLKIFIACLPAAITGIILGEVIEQKLRSLLITSAALIIIGILMIFIEKRIKNHSVRELKDVTYSQALIIGISQILALIPGTSRSGITIIVGIFSKIDKSIAIQFSFLIGLPILLGSFIYETFKSKPLPSELLSFNNILVVVISGITGYFSILLLEKFSNRNFLTFFGIYRIVLGAIIILLML